MDSDQVRTVGSQIKAEIQGLEVRNTANVRKVRRDFTRRLKERDPDFMLALAEELNSTSNLRWFGYELVRNHKGAFESLGAAELEALGRGMSSWNEVDEFGRILSGPAWLKGQISDALIHSWAESADFWWRRAALVSTVALNMRSQGGHGDVLRTLAVCRMLADDHEDMVVKAMSWALRELIDHDPEAVEGFIRRHDAALAARVKREVRNKLKTGLKNPKKEPANE
jgi:3-methyladenine DNA glycosylase AlkD